MRAILQAIIVLIAALFGRRRPDDFPAPPATLVERIILAMERKGHRIARGDGWVNIVYVEGMSPNGTRNDDAPNRFNDMRCVFWWSKGELRFEAWEATTEPGTYWTKNRMNPHGAARVAFGQYKAWSVGIHNGDHEALRQVKPITVYRDDNEDMQRPGDHTDTGVFYINQHHGYDLPVNDLGRSSAGCLVGRTRAGHWHFMSIVKSDPRYLADKTHVFDTAILSAEDVH
jgi:hypothetical protein